MKKTVFCIVKILLSAATIPLWFVKIFKGVGHLPDKVTGEIVEVIFRHSMFENMRDGFNSIPAYASMAVAIAAVVLNIIALKYPDSKKIQTIGNIIFGATIGLFLIMLLLASSVGRGY
ncbi:MAG: hypothetical protein E7477_08915 [Ruminococcaceae bacterium]|nr:hypothetical protein [Oscillospiraceae bacterium]